MLVFLSTRSEALSLTRSLLYSSLSIAFSSSNIASKISVTVAPLFSSTVLPLVMAFVRSAEVMSVTSAISSELAFSMVFERSVLLTVITYSSEISLSFPAPFTALKVYVFALVSSTVRILPSSALKPVPSL